MQLTGSPQHYVAQRELRAVLAEPSEGHCCSKKQKCTHMSFPECSKQSWLALQLDFSRSSSSPAPGHTLHTQHPAAKSFWVFLYKGVPSCCPELCSNETPPTSPHTWVQKNTTNTNARELGSPFLSTFSPQALHSENIYWNGG